MNLTSAHMFKYLKILLLFLVGIGVYFIFMSSELYRDVGCGYIPTLYYPIGFIVGIFLIVLIKKYLNINKVETFTLLTLYITLLVGFTITTQSSYGSILEDYYSYGYHSLFNFPRYAHSKGSYTKIYHQMKKMGIKSEYISIGYETNYKNLIYSFIDQEVTYNINQEYIIVFNWENEEVVDIQTKQQILDGAISYLSESLIIDKDLIKTDYFIDCVGKFSVGNQHYWVYVHPDNGKIAYSYSN